MDSFLLISGKMQSQEAYKSGGLGSGTCIN